jgi:hypothetical protein
MVTIEEAVPQFGRRSSHPGSATNVRTLEFGGFFRRYALRGRDPAMADENLYRYCSNAPMNGVDPSGMRECDDGKTLLTANLKDSQTELNDHVN